MLFLSLSISDNLSRSNLKAMEYCYEEEIP